MKIVIDARSVVGVRSGVGGYVEALVRHLLQVAEVASDLELLLLVHPSAQRPIAEDPRVSELPFPGETKSVHTVLTLAAAGGFGQFDLYHAPAELIPLRLRCPWVVTVHDLMWLDDPKLGSAFLPVRAANALWYRTNIRRAVAGAARILCPSHATARAVTRGFPGAADSVRVVHHGVDHGRLRPEPLAPLTTLPAGVGAGRFSLVVGQGSPYKNHAGIVRAFIEAFRDEPDHRLVLVRRFVRFDLDMRRLLARREVRERVVLLPAVSDATLIALYQNARALYFVSHVEGFGLPVLEAMAAGTPVLASSAEAVVEVAGGAALHVDSTDHAGMVAAMRRIHRDARLRRELVASGIERARDFSWRRCAESTLDVYREAVRHRRQPMAPRTAT